MISVLAVICIVFVRHELESVIIINVITIFIVIIIVIIIDIEIVIINTIVIIIIIVIIIVIIIIVIIIVIIEIIIVITIIIIDIEIVIIIICRPDEVQAGCWMADSMTVSSQAMSCRDQGPLCLVLSLCCVVTSCFVLHNKMAGSQVCSDAVSNTTVLMTTRIAAMPECGCARHRASISRSNRVEDDIVSQTALRHGNAAHCQQNYGPEDIHTVHAATATATHRHSHTHTDRMKQQFTGVRKTDLLELLVLSVLLLSGQGDACSLPLQPGHLRLPTPPNSVSPYLCVYEVTYTIHVVTCTPSSQSVLTCVFMELHTPYM